MMKVVKYSVEDIYKIIGVNIDCLSIARTYCKSCGNDYWVRSLDQWAVTRIINQCHTCKKAYDVIRLVDKNPYPYWTIEVNLTLVKDKYVVEHKMFFIEDELFKRKS